MTKKEFSDLQSGTDVRGTAVGGVNGPVTLTDEAVCCIAKAFCKWYRAKKGEKPRAVAVGHDSRVSAERIGQAFLNGLAACGCGAILTGLSSTPSMFMLLQEDFGADAAVMITASHLPMEKNGLKFFVKEGGLESGDVKEILELAAEETEEKGGENAVSEKSYIEAYAAGLVEKVRKATGKERPLEGKKIVVDAGNGAGGFYAGLVLSPLGADTSGSQFLDPDGTFPNHIPNPENGEAMKSVCAAVLKNRADLGVIFDTDVDRAAVVAPDGKEINRNRLIALISAVLLEEKTGATIVTDSVTSDGLTRFIESRGGVHRRFKRGYKNVINESKRLAEEGIYSPLAIETSGHAALAENYYLDDGAYLVTRLLIALAKKGDLESYIADLPEPEEAAEVRLRFREGADFKAIGAKLLSDVEAAVKKDPALSLPAENFEGVRICFGKENGDGWALVRMSLHEPILPVNMESNSPGGVKKIARTLCRLLAPYGEELGLEKLKNFEI